MLSPLRSDAAPEMFQVQLASGFEALGLIRCSKHGSGASGSVFLSHTVYKSNGFKINSPRKSSPYRLILLTKTTS